MRRAAVHATKAADRVDPGDLAPLSSCGGPAREPAGASFVIDGHTFSSDWIERTLHGVIANRCQSKNYGDILSLDGGTVGIAHFAVGSLELLYQQFNTARYFGSHAHKIPPHPYRFAWWRQGMRRFLDSTETRAAQQKTWRLYISPALTAAVAHGWRSERALAIAASVANSLGAYGFQSFAAANGWEAERILRAYAGTSAHRARRRSRLEREFPPKVNAANNAASTPSQLNPSSPSSPAVEPGDAPAAVSHAATHSG